MNDITWMAGTKTKEYSIWDDLHYSTEEKAVKAAEQLAKEYGGMPVVEMVNWRE